MWFITKVSSPTEFYNKSGHAIKVPEVNWVYTKQSNGITVSGSQPLVKDPMQAISALYQADIPGFKTKPLAREFGKTLPHGNWRYLEIR